MNEEGKEAQEGSGLNSSTGTRGHGEIEPGCPQAGISAAKREWKEIEIPTEVMQEQLSDYLKG